MAYLPLMALLLLISAPPLATAYSNHTVSGPAGWFFDVNKNTSSADYSAWSTNQTFNLGDYLIFNTTTNQTVIQTYNESTYRSCSIDDSLDNDTFQYGGGSNQFDQAQIVSIPLTTEGPNYYFSDADDGIQCQKGLAFEIVVHHGTGLPPSLNQPPPPPYVEPPSSGGEEGLSPPVTVAANQPNIGVGLSGANLRWLVYGCALLFGVELLM